MLQQIISHTPVYVWALLAFLLYRGYLAASDREVGLRNLFIIPAVMLFLSVSSMDQRFGESPLVWTCWLAGVAASAVLAWGLMRGPISVNRDAGTVLQRGSLVPLALMLSIFVTKYAIAVLLAINPAAGRNSAVAVAICTLFGVFNGIFLGRLGRYVAAYLRQPAASAA